MMAISNLRKWLATGLLSLAAATTVQADTFVFTAIPDEDEPNWSSAFVAWLTIFRSSWMLRCVTSR